MELHYKNKNLADIPNEIWIDAFGLDGLYEVSNKGRIKRLERTVYKIDGTTQTYKPKIVSQCVVKHNNQSSDNFSLYVRLTVDTNVYKTFTVAALILNSFKKPDKYNKHTHHINYISYDNRLENLAFIELETKRRMEYDADIRDGMKTIKKALSLRTAPLLTSESHKNTDNHRKGRRIIRKPNIITVFIVKTKEVYTYPNFRSASEQLNLKEYTLKNAYYKPHKNKKIKVRKGMLTLQDFIKE